MNIYGTFTTIFLLSWEITALAQTQAMSVEQPSLLQQAINRFEQKSGSGRIMGGTKAKWASNPWQVALVHANDPNNSQAQFCGGSYVAPRWVVTAAHCIDRRYGPERYQVLSGTDNLLQGGRRSRVIKYIVHERWRLSTNNNQYDNDIALLQIDPSSPELYGEPIPITSPSINLDILKPKILVTGWGVTERRPTGTESLMQITVPYVATSPKCNAKKSYGGRITDNMFCAGIQAGKIDSCQGDSGGPATALVNKRRVLVGIVSWGDGCGEVDKYGVYTRLTNYADWIKRESGGQVSY